MNKLVYIRYEKKTSASEEELKKKWKRMEIMGMQLVYFVMTIIMWLSSVMCLNRLNRTGQLALYK